MAGQPDNTRTEVLEWLTLAQSDLRSARALAAAGTEHARQTAYLSQQAAEKALKAFLRARLVRFPFTHSINALRDLVMPFASWAAELADADRLTSFATTTRYPGMGIQVTSGDAQWAL